MRVLLSLLLLPVVLLAGQQPAVTFDVAARSVQPGEVLLVSVTVPPTVGSVAVRAFDRAFAAYPSSDIAWQALVGVDLDVAPGPHELSVVASGPSERLTASQRLTVTAKAFPTRRLTVEPRYVEPPPEVTARIISEAERLNGIWASRTPERLWSGAFAAPVPDRANSAFGSRSVFNGQPRSPHGGADFASPSGRAVRAPNGGRVVLAEDLYYTGQSVVIDHGLGLVSLFAHLSEIDVPVDTLVKAGDVVGRVGATGRVTGPHLHWTVRLAGTRVDPLSLVHITADPADPSSISGTSH